MCVYVFACLFAMNLRENGDDGWKSKSECWPRNSNEIKIQVNWHALIYLNGLINLIEWVRFAIKIGVNWQIF